MPSADMKHGTDAEFRPLYLRIQSVLEERVVSGVYPAGTLLPTEIELSREFETSRFTIREALRNLHERGYLERRQGVGTRVINTNPKASYSLSASSLEELFQIAAGTWYVILGHERVTLDSELAEIVGGAEGEDWILVSGMRWTEQGGRPICYVQSYVPARFSDLIPRFKSHGGPLFSFLERHSEGPILKAVQEISALKMPAAIAPLLGQGEDAWALRLLRRYVADQGVLITSLNWHPSDQMTYVMEIHRQRPAAQDHEATEVR